MEKLIITVGITGSRITRQQTSYIPITPHEIAQSGIESWRAGASVLHVHVRDPKTGLGTQNISIFKEVVDRIRSETDAILCLTQIPHSVDRSALLTRAYVFFSHYVMPHTKS